MSAIDLVSVVSTKYLGEQRLGPSVDRRFVTGADEEYLIVVPAGERYLISSGIYTVKDTDTVIRLQSFNSDMLDERWEVCVVQNGRSYGPVVIPSCNSFRQALDFVTNVTVGG